MMYGLGYGVGCLHRMAFLIDTLFAAWVRLILLGCRNSRPVSYNHCRYSNVVIELEGVCH